MSATMNAMILTQQGKTLQLCTVPRPLPAKSQLLIKVHACAVCRTDLHIVDGDLKHPKLPLVPGHEVIGTIAQLGTEVTGFRVGDRIGVPWLGQTCRHCDYCLSGHENLCEEAAFTGYTLDGGFADYMVADHRYCFPIPDKFSDVDAAPLMCAGLIGFRAYRMVGGAQHIGLYGFGAAAHIMTQIAQHQERKIYAFTKPGDKKAQAFAGSLGAVWAGSSSDASPRPLNAAILFAPIGDLVPIALKNIAPGGTVVCAGIHMSDIPSFPYDILWRERCIRSVANLTREDGDAFLAVAPEVPVKTATHAYPLAKANDAIEDLRHGRLEGAAVLTMD